jgi:hypothetical protein
MDWKPLWVNNHVIGSLLLLLNYPCDMTSIKGSEIEDTYVIKYTSVDWWLFINIEVVYCLMKGWQ